MLKKKPCCICRRWSQPDPRIGARQRTCGAEQCQRKRRAESNRRWRKLNPTYDAGRRLQSKLDANQEEICAAQSKRKKAPESAPDPGKRLQVAWDVLQAEIGAKPTVILQEIAEVQRKCAQAEIRQQVSDIKKQFVTVGGNRTQAEMAKGP
jgi:hypothetical protein